MSIQSKRSGKSICMALGGLSSFFVLFLFLFAALAPSTDAQHGVCFFTHTPDVYSHGWNWATAGYLSGAHQSGPSGQTMSLSSVSMMCYANRASMGDFATASVPTGNVGHTMCIMNTDSNPYAFPSGPVGRHRGFAGLTGGGMTKYGSSIAIWNEACGFTTVDAALSVPGCYIKPETNPCLPGYYSSGAGNIAHNGQQFWWTTSPGPKEVAFDHTNGGSFITCCSSTGFLSQCPPASTCRNGGAFTCANKYTGSYFCSCPSNFNYDANCNYGCGDSLLTSGEVCDTAGVGVVSAVCPSCTFTLSQYQAAQAANALLVPEPLFLHESGLESRLTFSLRPSVIEPTIVFSAATSATITSLHIYDRSTLAWKTYDKPYASSHALSGPTAGDRSVQWTQANFPVLSMFLISFTFNFANGQTRSISSQQFATTCTCTYGATGAPAAYAVTQAGTSLLLTWRDDSTCEERFNVYRAAADPANPGSFLERVLVQTYAYRTKDVCYTLYAPSTVADTVNELTLGADYEYCMEAQTTVPYEYATVPSCQTFNIAFTSVFVASVTTKSGAGIYQAVIDVYYNDTLVASGLTSRTGEFKAVLTIPGVSNPVIDLRVAVSLSTEGYGPHAFTCFNVACNDTVVSASHLASVRASFIDTSVVAISGQVTIGSTAPYTGFFGSVGPACPVVDTAATVCVFDDTTSEEIMCSPLNPDASRGDRGTYALTVPIGTVARVAPSYTKGELVHTFLPASAVFEAKASDFKHVDFSDTTRKTLDMTLVASRCGFYLGPSLLQLKMSVICPNYVRTLAVSSDDGLVQTAVQLPAALYDATFDQFDPNFPDLWADPLDISPLAVPQYFDLRDERTVTADLSAGDASVRWEYHNPADLELRDIGTLFTGSPCDEPVRVVQRGRIYGPGIFVTENYGARGVCANVTGSVQIRDEMTDSKATKCASPGTCLKALTIDPITRVTSVRFGVQPAQPNIIPPFKMYLEFNFQTNTAVPNTNLVVPFVVEGDRERGTAFTLRMPPSVPQLILYDPPGDSSYAVFSKEHATSTVMSFSAGFSSELVIEATAKAGLEKDIDACIGLGASVCTGVVSTTVEVEAGITTTTSIETVNSRESSFSLATTATYSTSGSADTPPGRLQTVVMGVGYTMKYALVDTVTFVDATCSGSVTEHVKWAPENTKNGAVQINAIFDIEEHILPELARLLVIVTRTADTVRLITVNNAIDGWKRLVNRVDGRINSGGDAATVGPVKGNSQVQGNPVGNSITFAGGGSVIQMDSTMSTAESTLWEFGGVATVDIGAAGAVELEVGGLKAEAAFAMTLSLGVNLGGSKGSGKESATTVSYVLSDANPGDFYEVGVYKDKDFATPIFRVVAGSSSCPYEPHNQIDRNASRVGDPVTVKRETFNLFPRSAALVENLPDLGDATWTFEVQNLSPYEEDLALVLAQTGSTNPDALSIKYLAAALPTGGVSIDAPYVNASDPEAAPTMVLLTATRGPRAWMYDDIEITLASQCDGDLSVARTLSAHFLQPCAPIAWAGDLGLMSTATVNSLDTARPSRLAGYVKNTAYSESAWADHDRVEFVRVQYRATSELLWSSARDADGEVLELTEREDLFGFAAFEWDVANFFDGSYEIRAFVKCTPSPVGGEFDQALTTVMPVTIDRRGPALFAQPEPADGTYFPGDAVSFTFTEELFCTQPFVFQISVLLDGVEHGRDVRVLCSGNEIGVDFTVAGPTLVELSGKAVVVSIAGVRDTAGNLADEDVFTHTFVVAAFQDQLATATVEPLVFAIPYATFTGDERDTYIFTLITEIASGIQADSGVEDLATLRERLAISRLSETGTGTTRLALYVTAGVPTAPTLAPIIQRFVAAATASAIAAAQAAASEALRLSALRANVVDVLLNVDPTATRHAVAVRSELSVMAAVDPTVPAAEINVVPSGADASANAQSSQAALAELASEGIGFSANGTVSARVPSPPSKSKFVPDGPLAFVLSVAIVVTCLVTALLVVSVRFYHVLIKAALARAGSVDRT